MQTSRLISTISYNSSAFLSGRLSDLVKKGVLEYAHWILHKPDSDEKKSHFHLVLQPNKRLNTEALRKEFVELSSDSSKPLGVQPFRVSKMSDWLLYAVHDRAYLLQKGLQRSIFYGFDDLQSTEPDFLLQQWREASEGENQRLKQVLDLVAAGEDFMSLVQRGVIPLNQYFQYRDLVLTLQSRGLSNGTRSE